MTAVADVTDTIRALRQEVCALHEQDCFAFARNDDDPFARPRRSHDLASKAF